MSGPAGSLTADAPELRGFGSLLTGGDDSSGHPQSGTHDVPSTMQLNLVPNYHADESADASLVVLALATICWESFSMLA